jgi:nucleotide-binding universal stress UspA family protein
VAPQRIGLRLAPPRAPKEFIMKAFKKILVPTDFSAHSDEAIRVACDLAQRYGATISVLHVYEPVAYTLPEGYLLHTPDQLTLLFAEWARRLDQAKTLARQWGAPHVDSQQVDGIPYEEIAESARTGGYDLIVMGTHGRRGLDRLVMGSVAEKVLRHASCPVMCVRAT